MENGFTLRAKYMDHERTPPTKVVEWRDPESSAVGFLAVYSWRNGAAGGGTRMQHFADPAEARKTAIDLAKTMELKFRVSGPDIGGAKSVICHQPDIDKEGVLQRWFKFIWPYLSNSYGTGGDLNVDDKNVIRLFGEISREMDPGRAAVADPQQGIVYGFYGDHHGDRLRSLRDGVPQAVDEVDLRLGDAKATIADLITGFGVAYAAGHYHELRGEELAGKRVLIEGLGNVGAAAAYFLAEAGARVCGVITLDPDNPANLDRRLCVARSDGLDVKEIIRTRRITERGAFLGQGERIAASDQSFWDTPADVFIPAAASGTIDAERLKRLTNAGVRLISPGANVPFQSTALEEKADSQLSLIPDFIANCGMARAYAYFMDRWDEGGSGSRWPSLKADVQSVIGTALSRIHLAREKSTGYSERAYLHYIGEISRRP